MQTIGAQLSALAVTNSLKLAAVPGTLTNIPWQLTVGSWSEAAGWSPSSFVANPPTNTRSGLYLNTGEQSGDHAVGLKKTTGSLAAVERQFEVWMCSEMGAKASGYQLAVITNKTSNGKVRFLLRRFVEGEAKVLYETNEEQTFNENDSFYLAKVGTKLLIYYRSGEGTPTLLGGATDSTFTKGFCGFGGNGSNPRLINFTVGALTVSEEVTRIKNTGNESGTGHILTIGSCNRTEDVLMVFLCRKSKKPFNFFNERFIQITNASNANRGFGLGIVFGESSDTGAKLKMTWTESEGVSTTSETPAKIFTFSDHWRLVVARKEAGAKKADFGIYDFVTQEWQWEEGSEGAAAKAESLATGKVWLLIDNGNTTYEGDSAAAMIAPVMSRANCEALLPKASSLIDWRTAAAAVGLWFFNKSGIGEKLEDETGNGANQTNTPIGGKYVSTEAPPIPYYRPSTVYARPLIGSVIKFVKRWTLAWGAVRRA